MLRYNKRIQIWVRKRKLKNYGFRPAQITDLDFVMSQITDGANDGHYAKWLVDPNQAKSLRIEFERIINDSSMVRNSERGLEVIAAKLFIYGQAHDEQVGFFLYAEKIPGSADTDLELYKIGIRKDRQRCGHGRRIVQLAVAYAPPAVNLFARCYQPSKGMFKLLQEVGFSHTKTTNNGTRELVLTGKKLEELKYE